LLRRYDGQLRAATVARQQDWAVFPLSGTHYVEMSGILDPAQRTAVAEVMEPLSGFQVLLGRVTLAELEIDAMIDALLGSGSAGERIDLLGPTFGRAFGMRGGLTTRDADGNETSASMREEVGDREFERIMAEATRAFEMGMLAGPPDDEIAALRAAGYAPEKTFEVAERRAQQERDLSGRLNEDDKWRRGRLRDVISASELTHEWLNQITRATFTRGTTIGQVVREDRGRMRAFAEGMPSSRVAISLKTRYHATCSTSGPRTTSTTSTPSQSRCPTATLSSPTRRHATRSLHRPNSGHSERSFPASLVSWPRGSAISRAEAFRSAQGLTANSEMRSMCLLGRSSTESGPPKSGRLSSDYSADRRPFRRSRLPACTTPAPAGAGVLVRRRGSQHPRTA
jgi:hypothetical protein